MHGLFKSTADRAHSSVASTNSSAEEARKESETLIESNAELLNLDQALSPRSEYGSVDKGYETNLTDGIDDIIQKEDDDYNAVQAHRNTILQKVNHFNLPVDPDKGYKATRLSVFSFTRPHMRAFHGSWMCFCCAWLLWFSMAPLMSIIRESIPMTKNEVWTSNLCALVGTVIVRVIIGPLCDEYGGKDTLTALLAACAVPCLFAGLLIQDYASLLVVRSLIGCVGGTLVPVQFWVASQFTPECTGVAVATAAGWGALGGGIAQVFMGSFLFPFLRRAFGGDEDLAWRVALTVPAIISIATAFFFFKNADDCPLGNYKEVRAAGLLQQKSAIDSFRQGVFNLNAWILFIQFGASLGVELVCESGLAMHLSERFDMSTNRAAGLASLFGFMNIWSRGCGGYISDRLHQKFSLKGRFSFQMILLLLEGILLLGFIRPNNSLTTTIIWMVAFAATGQMAMGTCFGIIPFIDPRCTGTIAGIVAAGGNLGGVFLSNTFRTSTTDTDSFHVMAYFCIAASLLSPFLVVSGYQGMVW
eukprot:CAMPEP_0198153484 /NCGR_PEP_ID=MMETSP1443-20131203/64365_1 /TAXON_ID=186043 /ORGANISM="Entomoneis sp., Strain CCMP2396" /LENGTH=530 /DNA_ID=CAMNT_0043819831 /DNA_START=295 /DNA_END=1884 /DNA_ORIENTATION=+